MMRRLCLKFFEQGSAGCTHLADMHFDLSGPMRRDRNSPQLVGRSFSLSLLEIIR